MATKKEEQEGISKECLTCKRNGKCSRQKKAAKQGMEMLWCGGWKEKK